MKANIISKKIIMLVMIALTVIGVVFIFIGNSYAKLPITVNTNEDVSGISDMTNMGNRVIGIIQVVGILLAVGIIMVIGIKYMMGSAEEKAEYKKVMIPYIIGAIILFGASAIAPAVANMVSSLVP